jgi:hypothetical protein
MVDVIHGKLLRHVHLIALVVILYVTLTLAKMLPIVWLTVLAMPTTSVNLGKTQNIVLGTVVREQSGVRVMDMTQMMDKMVWINNMTEVTEDLVM